jgi:hypothetical protein
VITPYYHVGLVVTDLKAAMSELSAGLGVTWEEPHHSTYGDWGIDVVYSMEGPPYIELIQGGADGPWSSAGGPRLDHFGYACQDPIADGARLFESGFSVDFDPTQVGKDPTFTYYRGQHSGARVELLGAGVLEHLRARSPQAADPSQ